MEYRREIDGLRALAVVPVILFHAGFQFFGGGFVGVDVFFVISGYLITSIILAEKTTGTFTLANFYERRARRILPALFLVMFACLPFAWFWLLPPDMQSFSQSLVAVSAFASNILFWRTSGYFETAAELKPLLHTWSLAVEEQYYVLFPVFLMLVWRLGKRWVVASLGLAAALSLALAQWGVVIRPTFAFFMLPTRGWEILVGAFIAFHFAEEHRPRIPPWVRQALAGAGLLLICLAIAVFDKNTPFPSVYALVPTLGAALIILFATPETLAGRLLGSKAFVGIGLVSYSAYLWHQPLLAFARHRSMDDLGQGLLASLCAASLVLAYFSWRFVETPLRNRKRFDRRKIFLYGAIGSVFFAGFGLVGHLTRGYFHRSYPPTFLRIEAAAAEVGKNGKCWDNITESRSLAKACTVGADGAERNLAILGDSHAGALVHEIGVAASARAMGAYDYTYNGCLPLRGGSAKERDAFQLACSGMRQDLWDRLQKHTLPKTFILLSRWTIWLEKKRFDNKEGGIEHGEDVAWFAPESEGLGYAAALKKSYRDSVRKMLDAGYKVVLVYPVPEVGWDVPTRLGHIHLSQGHLDKGDVSTSHQVFIERNRQAYEALDAIGEHPNLVRVWPEKIFCDTLVKGRCVTHINGAPLYFDDDHLSNAGARLVVAEVMKSVSR